VLRSTNKTWDACDPPQFAKPPLPGGEFPIRKAASFCHNYSNALGESRLAAAAAWHVDSSGERKGPSPPLTATSVWWEYRKINRRCAADSGSSFRIPSILAPHAALSAISTGPSEPRSLTTSRGARRSMRQPEDLSVLCQYGRHMLVRQQLRACNE